MTSTTSTLQAPFPADVLAFAAAQGAADLLRPVWDMTRRVFPHARRLEALLEDDPELTDDRHIVFEVEVGPVEVASSVERHWQWSRELFQLCPATHVCLFGLHVQVGDA